MPTWIDDATVLVVATDGVMVRYTGRSGFELTSDEASAPGARWVTDSVGQRDRTRPLGTER